MKLSGALTSVFLILVWLEASIRLREKGRRQPLLTGFVCLVLSLCLLAQLRDPQLLVLFERNTTLIFDGEWWRILTAFFFQDGLIVGGVTNIALLFAIGSLGEQVWRRSDWLMIGIAGVLAGEILALRWEPIGAGNSIATCSFAGALIGLKTFRQASLSSRLLKGLALVTCLVLVTVHDIHGAAGMAGVLVGLTRSVRR